MASPNNSTHAGLCAKLKRAGTAVGGGVCGELLLFARKLSRGPNVTRISCESSGEVDHQSVKGIRDRLA